MELNLTVANTMPTMDKVEPELTSDAVAVEGVTENPISTKILEESLQFSDIFKQQFADLSLELEEEKQVESDLPVLDDESASSEEEEVSLINLYFPQPESMGKLTTAEKPTPSAVASLSKQVPSDNAYINTDSSSRKFTRPNPLLNNPDVKSVDELMTMNQATSYVPLESETATLKTEPKELTIETDMKPLMTTAQENTREANVTALNKPVQNTAIEMPISSKQWPEEFAQRILFISQQPVKSAIMQVNPPQLGPLEIQVSIHQEQTTVQIASQHAIVRDIIETSLPKLRELFQEQGLQLAQSTVSQDSLFNQQFRQSSPMEQVPYDSEQIATEVDPLQPKTLQSQKLTGMVDYYI